MTTSYKFKSTAYKQIKETEPLWIIFDGGNTDVKSMIHARFGEEIFFPHAVQKMDNADYEVEASSYGRNLDELLGTVIFKYNNQGYKIGEHSKLSAKGERITGSAKYTRDHFGAMFIAAMLQLYPKSHPNVRVVVLHPPRLEAANKKSLGKSINGVHVVTVPTKDGKTIDITYDVQAVILREEPVAALQTFILGVNGRQIDKPKLNLTPNSQVLVLDIGGAISVFVPCFINAKGGIEINYDAEPINAGIQNVEEALRAQLKNSFPELVTSKGIEKQLITEALTGVVNVKGYNKNCTKQLDAAMSAIAGRIKEDYINKYGNGSAYRGIIMTGGGSVPAFEYIKKHVLKHDFTFQAEDTEVNMRFGAIRGASKGLIGFLETETM